MWSSHVRRITRAKDQIALVELFTSLVQSAACRDGANTRGLVKLKIENMLADNVIQPAQT